MHLINRQATAERCSLSMRRNTYFLAFWPDLGGAPSQCAIPPAHFTFSPNTPHVRPKGPFASHRPLGSACTAFIVEPRRETYKGKTAVSCIAYCVVRSARRPIFDLAFRNRN